MKKEEFLSDEFLEQFKKGDELTKFLKQIHKSEVLRRYLKANRMRI